MKNYLCYLLVFVFIALSCNTKKAQETPKTDEEIVMDEIKRSQRKRKKSHTIENSNNEVSLVGYLRKVPGLRVRGSGTNAQVNVLGINASISMPQQPLFILNGSRIGNSLSDVERLVNVQHIDQIQVLKSAAETSIYGIQGSSGVILITTK